MLLEYSDNTVELLLSHRHVIILYMGHKASVNVNLKLLELSFPPLEVVSRYREPQVVGENNLIRNIFQCSQFIAHFSCIFFCLKDKYRGCRRI